MVDGVVFSDTESINELFPNSLGNVDYDKSHYDYWKLLQKVYPEFRSIDYDYYPRGRVVYNKTNDIYKLFVDPCISDQFSVDKIVDDLNLPYNKVVIDSNDEHYHCSSCNENYSEYFENY